MSLIYITTNLLNSTTLPADDATYRSSEDAIYQVEYLYNKRPSLPFRWTAKVGDWVKVELTERQIVSFAGIFGHNLTSAATVQLHASGWNGGWKLIKNFTHRPEDMYIKFGAKELWWRLSVSDAGNSAYPQIGEFVLGLHSTFANAKVTPGRSDGPTFFMGDNVTHYGQDWDNFYSDAETMSISLRNVNDPTTEDDVQTFLKAIFRNEDGRFILIPDDTKPQCYYVKVMNRGGFADRLVYGSQELRDWRMEVKTLTKGITLL